MESKPMNDANNRAEAGPNTLSDSGEPSASGIARPSRRIATTNAEWSNENPATITTAPSANVRNINGTIRRSYDLMPRRFTAAAVQRNASGVTRRAAPESSTRARDCHPAASAMSLKNGAIRYETTPVATHNANHCENEATKPRYGSSARLA